MGCEVEAETEEGFTHAEIMEYADKHGIPIFYLGSYDEFDSNFYEAGIIHFTEPDESLELLQHIHNLNVLCGHMMKSENTNT
jgi:hypothetical protein